jgi:hypothetical protein
MRASIIFSVLTAFLFNRCRQKGDESNLEGTYSSQATGKYAVAYDTLVISPSNADAKLYFITLKTSFQKIRHGKLFAKEHLLIENEIGRKLQYQPTDGTIIWNISIFKKFK